MIPNSNKCPCEGCICIPICRYKKYNAMLKQCSILMDLLYKKGVAAQEFRQPQFNKHIKKAEKHLKPRFWTAKVNDRGFTEIEGKGYDEED